MKKKIVLVGSSKVGKTFVVNKWYKNERYNANNYEETVLPKLYERKIIYGSDQRKNKSVVVEMWDTCGNKEHIPILDLFLSDASGVILLFDPQEVESINYVKKVLKACNIKKYIVLGNNRGNGAVSDDKIASLNCKGVYNFGDVDVDHILKEFILDCPDYSRRTEIENSKDCII